MASLIFATFYCINAAVMSHREKKQIKQQEHLQQTDPNDAPSAKRAQKQDGETLREKAARKLHGKDANPSQLGDPISLKAETSNTIPTEEDEGTRRISEATTLRDGTDGNGNGSGTTPQKSKL